jgi:phosphatidate cytidylyltransferase
MLKTRILTALVLLACFIPALFYLPVTPWAILMLLISLVALHEWGGMLALSNGTLCIYMLLGALFGIVVIYMMNHIGLHMFFHRSVSLFKLVAIFWCVIVPIWLAKSWIVSNRLILMGLGLFLMGTLWLALIAAKWLNPWVLFIIISIVWIADTAAYFSGKNFGKHKLAPSISPGKTWEGVWGALIANTAFSLFLLYIGAVDSWIIVPAIWLITAVSVYGDLFESMFKRQANIKDSGRLLPGHGGVLDRIDGIVPALPIAVLMLYSYHYIQSIL